jgi:carbonic anhydrase
MLGNIRPAVLKVAAGESDPTSKNKKFVQSVAEQNARDAASQLTARSEVLAALVEKHQLKIVAAMHDVSTGAIRWLA